MSKDKSGRGAVLKANPVKGATPRAYETHPKPKGDVYRGTECKIKAGKKL